ncbi:protein big brother [Sitophilus oryzae]|uniref:Protein big brother n=1 Tax=Sitophilus oryzae TaxID=7048 RepID=A0A6J2Y3A4_SITOR|nr:protein big brother [Sitophilus oryzae]
MSMLQHESLFSMVPSSFEGIPVYEQPRPRFIFKMPRVVPDQKGKFESDELFRRLSRDSEVRYTGHRERPQEERMKRFINACQEGHTEIAFTATGTNLQLIFDSQNLPYATQSQCEFQKEQNKVNIKSSFIMNGVCVRWRGWIDLDRLDGVGCLEFDEEAALNEDRLLRQQMERYSQRLRDFEDSKVPRRPDNLEELRMANNLAAAHGHHSHLAPVAATSRCHGPQRTDRRMT